MSQSSEWKTFFDHHAPQYMDEPFVNNTEFEVQFLIEHLQLQPGQWVLDMGCGTGRHAVELAKQGYHIVGADLSTGMLKEAQKAANEASTSVQWVQADATKLALTPQFDAAYCVCEGAFGLLGAGADPISHDAAILKNLYRALKPGKRLLITVLSAVRMLRMYTQEDIAAGRFDPMTLSESHTMTTESSGEKIEVAIRERAYVPSELRLLLQTVGFEILHIGGGTAGNWAIRDLDMDEFELMALVRKPE